MGIGNSWVWLSTVVKLPFLSRIHIVLTRCLLSRSIEKIATMSTGPSFWRSKDIHTRLTMSDMSCVRFFQYAHFDESLSRFSIRLTIFASYTYVSTWRSSSVFVSLWVRLLLTNYVVLYRLRRIWKNSILSMIYVTDPVFIGVSVLKLEESMTTYRSDLLYILTTNGNHREE